MKTKTQSKGYTKLIIYMGILLALLSSSVFAGSRYTDKSWLRIGTEYGLGTYKLSSINFGKSLHDESFKESLYTNYGLTVKKEIFTKHLFLESGFLSRKIKYVTVIDGLFDNGMGKLKFGNNIDYFTVPLTLSLITYSYNVAYFIKGGTNINLFQGKTIQGGFSEGATQRNYNDYLLELDALKKVNVWTVFGAGALVNIDKDGYVKLLLESTIAYSFQSHTLITNGSVRQLAYGINIGLSYSIALPTLVEIRRKKLSNKTRELKEKQEQLKNLLNNNSQIPNN